MVAQRLRTAPLPVEEFVGAAFCNRRVGPVGERAGVVGGDGGFGWRRVHAEETAQIVRQQAGPDNQHVLVAQRRERLADAEMPGRIAMRVDGDLHDRDVGVRVHQHKRRPRAVIVAARRVEARRKSGIAEQGGGAFRESGIAGCGILLGVHLRRKAAEIVDHRRVRMRRQRRAGRLEVRAGDEDRRRAQRSGGGFEKVMRGCRIDHDRRRPVADEEGGLACHAP